MNWNDAQTDALLDAGKTALDPVVRAASYGEVLEQVHDAAVWIPLYHEPMIIAQSDALETIVPHNIYGCGLYKGLDLKFRE
jgi:peptide/nickel transport system substrate-binding protein